MAWKMKEEILTDGSKVCNITNGDYTMACYDKESAISVLRSIAENTMETVRF